MEHIRYNLARIYNQVMVDPCHSSLIVLKQHPMAKTQRNLQRTHCAKKLDKHGYV